VTAPAADALARFNDAPPSEAAELAFGWLAAPAFAMVLTAGRPYATTDALVTKATDLAGALSWRHASAALAVPPRTGEAPGPDADDAPDAAVAEATRAYEERFGHALLLSPADRSPAEVLTEVQRRLAHTPEAEQAEVRALLVEVTAQKVRAALG
jgi:2-oxo-4-hydroxy-4-carboxy-5-ureidoimidazoline decarboxylase